LGLLSITPVQGPFRRRLRLWKSGLGCRRARYVRDVSAVFQPLALSQGPPTLGAVGNRRQFGSVRKLASGRWQASYWWEGTRYAAPSTFPLRGDATRWLSGVRPTSLGEPGSILEPGR